MWKFWVGSGAPKGDPRSWGGFHPLSPWCPRQALPFMCVKRAHSSQKMLLPFYFQGLSSAKPKCCSQKESTFCPSHEREFGKRTISVLHKILFWVQKEFSSFNSFLHICLMGFWLSFDRLLSSGLIQNCETPDVPKNLGEHGLRFAKKKIKKNLQEVLRQSDTKCTSQPYLNFTLGFVLRFTKGKSKRDWEHMRIDSGEANGGFGAWRVEEIQPSAKSSSPLRKALESPGNAGAGSESPSEDEDPTRLLRLGN